MNINYICLLPLYSITTYFFYKITCCFAPIKQNKIIKTIVFLALSFVPNVIIFNNDIVNISYTLLAFILIIVFGYEGMLIKKLSAILVLYPIVVALNFASSYIFLYQYFPSNFNWMEIIITRAIVASFWFLIYKFAPVKIANAGKYLSNKMWLMIDIICLSPLIAIMATIINTTEQYVLQIFPIAFASIITNLGIIFLVGYMVDNVQIGLENENLKLQKDYYQELEKNQQEIRKLRHDINNHLSTIGSFLDNNNIQEAKDYFVGLSSIVVGTHRVFCENSIVNAVLNAKYHLAIQNNIDCFFNINISEPISINNIDLCSLFANTLDNAIEACLNIKELSLRKIEVKARCDKGYFSYLITNNSANKIHLIKGAYISTKQDKRAHGFGLKNIHDTVEKYNGTMDISYTESSFSVLIIISINC